MTNNPEKKEFRVLIAMAVIAVCLVVGGVYLFITYSNNATEDAVNKASVFYLEEMGTSMSQVFSSHFDGYYKELNLAMYATQATAPKTDEALDEHLKTMAGRGNFLYYALLDEAGNVYISDEAYHSEELVDFLLSCDFASANENITLERRPERDGDIFIIAAAAPEGIVINGRAIVADATAPSRKSLITSPTLS